MLKGVVYRLIESLASMGHSSILKLICAISVCNTLTVGVHLPSTPSVSGPGSATVYGAESHIDEMFLTNCCAPEGNRLYTCTSKVYEE